MNQLTKGTLVFYLVAIFVAGATAGMALGYTSGRRTEAQPPPPLEMAQHIQSRLQRRLGLTPEQVAKIRPVIEQGCAEMGSIHRESLHRVTETFRKLNQKIAEHLTAEQRDALDQLERERREKVCRKCSNGKS